MVKKWIGWVNYGMCGIIALLLLSSIYYYFSTTTNFPPGLTEAREPVPPKSSFARTKEHYDAIGEPALSLYYSPLSVQLPDLRRFLTYYGKNGRPDAKEEKPFLYFLFNGNKTPTPVAPGERYYILYDRKQSPPQYVFSPRNAITPLWIEVNTQGNGAIVHVGMQVGNDQDGKENVSTFSFNLPEKEFPKNGGSTWELGAMKVDGTLLARQKARWYGIDKFILRHGGDEFKEFQNKQRIDFGDKDKIYSIYVQLGDCVIWDKDERWKVVEPGAATVDRPLMCVKKVDERVMNLELWDVDGKGRITLNLIRVQEPWRPQNLEQSFKFIGARTRSQYIFEINNERMTLSPEDWLVQTPQGWKKLDTPEEIDDYVERRLIGPLFVFDGVEKKAEKQVMTGVLFNASRTESAPIEISLQQGSPAQQKETKNTNEQKPPAPVIPHNIPSHMVPQHLQHLLPQNQEQPQRPQVRAPTPEEREKMKEKMRQEMQRRDMEGDEEEEGEEEE